MRAALAAATLVALIGLVAAPAASAGPLVTVYQDGDRVCFYFSEQVPQCTPGASVQDPDLPPVAACVPGVVAPGCLLTVFTTDDEACFYPTPAPTFCVAVR